MVLQGIAARIHNLLRQNALRWRMPCFVRTERNELSVFQFDITHKGGLSEFEQRSSRFNRCGGICWRCYQGPSSCWHSVDAVQYNLCKEPEAQRKRSFRAAPVSGRLRLEAPLHTLGEDQAWAFKEESWSLISLIAISGVALKIIFSPTVTVGPRSQFSVQKVASTRTRCPRAWSWT